MTAALATIKLYGHLGRRFGKLHHFAIDSPREAISALCANYDGFREHLIKHSLPGYHVLVGGRDICAEELPLKNAAGKIIKIIPKIEGAGGNGVLQTIVGIVLVVWSYFPQFGGNPAMFNMGVALIIGGVSQMLFSPPALRMADGAERPENTPNYVFHGPINTEAQGHPVPVLLGGPLRIGSAVISAGISADAFTADNDTIGSGFRVINKGSYTFGYRYPTAPGADISLPLLATDGVPAYTWSFLSNPGSIFSIVAGALTTLDLPAGGYTVVVMATDSTAAEAIKEITIYSIAEGSGGDGDDPT